MAALGTEAGAAEGWTEEEASQPHSTRQLSRSRTICAAIDRAARMTSSHRQQPVSAEGCCCVHILGADIQGEGQTEAETLLVFDDLFAACERRSYVAVDLFLVGPNIPPQLAGQEFHFERTAKSTFRKANAAAGEGSSGRQANATCQIRLRYSSDLYHDCGAQVQNPAPALLVCFNAGVWGYDDWLPTLDFSLRQVPCPLVVTSYSDEEGREDQSAMQDGLSDASAPRWLWSPGLNPFRSLERRPSQVSDKPMFENHSWQCILGAAWSSHASGHKQHQEEGEPLRALPEAELMRLKQIFSQFDVSTKEDGLHIPKTADALKECVRACGSEQLADDEVRIARFIEHLDNEYDGVPCVIDFSEFLQFLRSEAPSSGPWP